MQTHVHDPIDATAVVVDLRGFTRELNVTHEDDGSRAEFCGLLAQMNHAVVDCARLALRPDQRDEIADLVHIGATGDGALVVFTHPGDHVRHAALATLLLRRRLHSACGSYPARSQSQIDFGIGVESGQVREVGATGAALELSTFIGSCINLAARVQDLTKVIARTRVVYGEAFVEALLEELFHEDWDEIVVTTPSGAQSDEEYLSNERRRIALNRRLCLNFLHQHRARGFPEPRSLFRLSRSSATPGNPRFEAMLRALADGEPVWLEEIHSHL